MNLLETTDNQGLSFLFHSIPKPVSLLIDTLSLARSIWKLREKGHTCCYSLSKRETSEASFRFDLQTERSWRRDRKKRDSLLMGYISDFNLETRRTQLSQESYSLTQKMEWLMCPWEKHFFLGIVPGLVCMYQSYYQQADFYFPNFSLPQFNS